MIKYIRNICGFASGFLLLGTAGSSDLDRITNEQIIYQLAIVLALAFISLICHRAIVLHRIARRRNSRKTTVKSISRRIG